MLTLKPDRVHYLSARPHAVLFEYWQRETEKNRFALRTDQEAGAHSALHLETAGTLMSHDVVAFLMRLAALLLVELLIYLFL